MDFQVLNVFAKNQRDFSTIMSAFLSLDQHSELQLEHLNSKQNILVKIKTHQRQCHYTT